MHPKLWGCLLLFSLFLYIIFSVFFFAQYICHVICLYILYCNCMSECVFKSQQICKKNKKKNDKIAHRSLVAKSIGGHFAIVVDSCDSAMLVRLFSVHIRRLGK